MDKPTAEQKCPKCGWKMRLDKTGYPKYVCMNPDCEYIISLH